MNIIRRCAVVVNNKQEITYDRDLSIVKPWGVKYRILTWNENEAD